jgi:hypothetical protein
MAAASAAVGAAGAGGRSTLANGPGCLARPGSAPSAWFTVSATNSSSTRQPISRAGERSGHRHSDR